MAQQRRKDFLIQSFGIPAALKARMQAEVERQNRNTRAAPLNVSEWIRRALERDLHHAERSRRTRRKLVVPVTPPVGASVPADSAEKRTMPLASRAWMPYALSDGGNGSSDGSSSHPQG